MTIEKRRGRAPKAGGKAAKRVAPRRAETWDEMNIFEKIIERGKRIPPDELARHPKDGAANLDHYLYGVPKDEPD